MGLSNPTSHMIDRMNPNRSAAGFDLTAPTPDQRTSLEADLTLEESDVLLRQGTEAAFCGGLLDEHRDGVFTCRLCGLPLFLAGDNSRAAPAGRASPPHSMKSISRRSEISAMAYSARSFSAHAVVAIKGTSSRAARRHAAPLLH
jgi:hypothetical protein